MGKIGIKAFGVDLLGVYHDFAADRGDEDHGNEWGVRISRTFYDHLTLALKYADYNADNTATATEKLWLTVQVKF